MKKYLVILFLLLLAVACRKSDGKPTETVIGSSTVDLDANQEVIRRKEALIGNFIADAILEYYLNKGQVADVAMINGGNIRFNTAFRPDGIYPAGNLTAEMMDEMLPFGNFSYIVTLKGSELKQILERSVAQYPLAKGPFMQISNGMVVYVDTLKQSQVININEDQIVSDGLRIDSIYFNDKKVIDTDILKVIFPDYIANGNDGYVTLKNLDPSKKILFEDNQTNAIKDYVILNSPIKPVLEGRIVFN